MRRSLTGVLLSLVLIAAGGFPRSTASPVAAGGRIVPLEALPMISGNGCVISAVCPGTAHGQKLTHGLHIDGSTHAEIRLDKHYTTLGGTIYLDDTARATNVSFQIHDTTSGASRQIYSAYLWTNQPVTFAIGVAGLQSIDLTPNGSVDVVANLQAAGAAPAPAPIVDAPATLPSRHIVDVVLPTIGLTLNGAGIVPFAWRPYPAATTYLLQVWLVRAAPGAKVTPQSRVNVATVVTGTQYELSTARMPKGTYAWRIAAMSRQGALISTWTPEATVTLM